MCLAARHANNLTAIVVVVEELDVGAIVVVVVEGVLVVNVVEDINIVVVVDWAERVHFEI